MQNHQAKFFSSPIVSSQVLQFNLNGIDNDKLGFLASFVKNRRRLAALKFLPELVEFYKLINFHFAYRLTLPELLEFTVPNAIKKLEKTEPLEIIEELKFKWTNFKEVWNNIRNIIFEIRGCPRQNDLENYVIEIDDDTPIGNLQIIYGTYTLSIGALVTHHGENDSFDEIIRMCIELTKIQTDLLTARNGDEKEKLPLEFLPFNSDNRYLLITGDEGSSDFQDFVLSQISLDNSYSRDSIAFNWERIQEFAVRKYTNGRRELSHHTIRKSFCILTNKGVHIAPQLVPEKKINVSELFLCSLI